MEIDLYLAGTNISIIFLGKAEKAVPLFNLFFRDFLSPERTMDGEIEVSVLNMPEGMGFTPDPATGEPIMERLVPTRDVAALLKQVPDYRWDFPINEATVTSFCMDGLLLFDPDSKTGRIFLLNKGPGVFKPLFRLFWIYFAQVLGEEGGCFLHGAALAKEEKGYIFMGESGAGKSTLASLSRNCHVLSDDSPVFRLQGGEYCAFSSPFHQLGPLDRPGLITTGTRVRGLYFLVKDQEVFLDQVSRKQAFSMIITRHIHFFSYLSARARKGLFDLLFDACDSLLLYNLHFRRDQDVLPFVANS